MSGEALAGALEYAAAGIAVGPVTLWLGPDGKKRQKYHTRWSKPGGISTDPEQLAAWAKEHPGCGWHAPCGPNGLVVVDQDVERDPHGEVVTDGRRSWRMAGAPTSPMTVTTQSGGRQLYFRASGEPIVNSARALQGIPHVDVRGVGGTVYVSGTEVRGGGTYAAARVVPVADLPTLPEQWQKRLRVTRPNSRAPRTGTSTGGTGRRPRLVLASEVHDLTWIEARVEDELREITRGGRQDFRARLWWAASLAYRGVACGVIGEQEAEERLHGAVWRVWGAEPNRDDLEHIASGRRNAEEHPWRVTGLDMPDDLADESAPEVPPADEDPPADPDRRGLEREVERELRVLRARQEAQRRLRAEGRTVERPTAVVLSDFLAIEDEPQQYRVEGLLPVGARAMLAAQAKAGKSTLRDNLTRSLVDGLPFLGEHAVEPFAGRVVLIDAELDERMLRRWLREQRIEATDRVAVVSLRGRVSSFDLTDPAVRGEWAGALRELEPAVVVLDCLRPILDAIGLDEDKDAGRFLVAFDELLELAGAGEAVVVHHMGHNGERARGSTRLRDWPDVEWRLTRKDAEDPSSPRYFTAHGRDVDQPERELGYDAKSRRLTVIGGSRQGSDALAAADAILELLAEGEGLSGRKIEQALTAAHAQRPIRDGLKSLVRSGRVVLRTGPQRAHLHYFSDEYRRERTGSGGSGEAPSEPASALVRGSASAVRERGPSECVSASKETHSHALPHRGVSASREDVA